MLIQQMIEIHDIAKTKKDGVYSKYGIKYAVQNHHLKFYAEDGDIYQVVGIFGTHIGKVEIYEVTKRLKLLLADLGV